jgi:hypothetical protein
MWSNDPRFVDDSGYNKRNRNVAFLVLTIKTLWTESDWECMFKGISVLLRTRLIQLSKTIKPFSRN